MALQKIRVTADIADAIGDRDATVVGRFEAQARRQPDAIAVYFDNDCLSYRQLDELANQLAQRLLALGVGAEALVGLCVERALIMPVAVLAVLKAGAAYVPLDPEYPARRLQYIIENAAIELVVTQDSLRACLPEQGFDCVIVESMPVFDPSQTAAPVAAAIAPNCLAYVLYTSGSTGQPKGVAVEHRSVNALVDWGLVEFEPAYLSGVLASTSLNFDLSVIELFIPLVAGTSLILVENALAVVQSPVQHHVTMINTVPSIAQALVNENLVPASVQAFICGGEPLRGSLCQQLYALPNIKTVFNCYGPTETTVYSTCAVVASSAVKDPHLGSAIPGEKIYLLDQDLTPVADGTIGEVFIAGVGLAREYLRQPKLTSERFLTVPAAQLGEPGAGSIRIYRSGDLGCRTAEANLEFHGRIDDQIKLRGFRIELEEIQSCLNLLPQVQQAVVKLVSTRNETSVLAAFYVPDASDVDVADDIKAELQARLPAYMMPDYFIAMAVLPLSINGKLDRSQLPDSVAANVSAPTVAETVQTDTHILLSQLWQEVLGLSFVPGLDDDFLDLGGDSISLVRLISRLEALYNKKLSSHECFSEPTIASVAQALEGAVLVASSLPPLVVMAKPEVQPLSLGQQRLWFLNAMDLAAAYNISLGCSIRGAIDRLVLQRSLQMIEQRHLPLRSRISVVANEPCQQWRDTAPIKLDELDLIGAPDAQVQAAIDDYCARPFNLATGPMWRALLIATGDHVHTLVLCIHHIVADGWSLNIIQSELATAYAAFSTQSLPVLASLAVDYSDYTNWQRQWLDHNYSQREMKFWHEQLHDVAPVHRLPLDHPRRLPQQFDSASLRFTVDAATTGQLRSVGRAHHATLYMVLLTAYVQILAERADHRDWLIASPSINRNNPQLEALVGFFANTLLMRIKWREKLGFSELLVQVRDMARAVYQHQYMPFEQIVEHLNPQRSLYYQPLAQIAFAFHNMSQHGWALADLEITPISIDDRYSPFELQLHVVDTGTGLAAEWKYNVALFDTATIAAMSAQLQTCLATVCAQSTVAEFDSAALVGFDAGGVTRQYWNQTATDYPRDASIPQLFADCVRSYPNAIALVNGSEQISYAELDALSNRIARCLIDRGVVPEEMVGISAERSIAMVAGILGIVKAGAAYVPLDPEYPQERLRYVVQDAAISVLLLSAQTASLDFFEGQRVYLDDAVLASYAPASMAMDVRAGQLAYVCYTSGSTGKPKGVLIEHRAVLRLVCNADYCQFGRDRTFILSAPTAFDAFTFQLWGAILHGAKLVLTPNGAQFMAQLPSLVKSHGVTTLFLTTSLFNHYVEQGLADFVGVEQLFVGGETLSPKHICRALDELPATTLINCYGPTESTTFATTFVIPKNFGHEAVPIGRPIANTQTYVLDEQLRPVALTEPGELFIGGDGLARAYLNQPQITAERFVEISGDRLGRSEALVRLYRTGDRVFRDHSGNLQFLGRLDNQIKLRGFRIELDEIELVVASLPMVHQCVVLLQDDSGDKQLIAYIKLDAADFVKLAELRKAVADLLPGYMIPALFVPMTTLPLTANGKVDRKALPTMSAAALPVRASALPKTATERAVAQLWAQALGRKPDHSDISFFDAGGHSIMLAKLAAALNAHFNCELALADLFRNATISTQAALIDRAISFASNAAIYEILHPQAGGIPLFFIHIADGGREFLDQYLPSQQRIYLIHSQSTDGRFAEFTSVTAIAKFYRDTIETLYPDGPYMLAGYSVGAVIAYEIAQQMRRDDKVVAKLVMLSPAVVDRKPVALKHANSAVPHKGFTSALAWLRHFLRYNLYLFGMHSKILAAYLTRSDIPHELRWVYLTAMYKRAVNAYQPEPYDGELVLVGEQGNDISVWSKRAIGKLTQEPPLSCGHYEVFMPANGHIWLKHLSSLAGEPIALTAQQART